MQSDGELGYQPASPKPPTQLSTAHASGSIRTRRLPILTLLAQPTPAAQSQALAAFAYRVGQAFR